MLCKVLLETHRQTDGDRRETPGACGRPEAGPMALQKKAWKLHATAQPPDGAPHSCDCCADPSDLPPGLHCLPHETARSCNL